MQYNSTIIKKTNCIPNFARLESTIDNGIINRGKYTFPNKF